MEDFRGTFEEFIRTKNDAQLEVLVDAYKTGRQGYSLTIVPGLLNAYAEWCEATTPEFMEYMRLKEKFG